MRICYFDTNGSYSYKINSDGIKKALKQMQIDHIIVDRSEIDHPKLKQFNPDFVLTSSPCDHMSYLLKNKGFYSVAYDLEGCYDLDRLIKTDSPNFDLIATVDKSAKVYLEQNTKHKNVLHLPLGFNPELYRPIIDNNYQSDILISGVLFDSRVKIIDFLYPLKNKGYDIVVVGSWLNRIRRRDHLSKVIDVVSPEEYIKYCSNTRIILLGNRDFYPNNSTINTDNPVYASTPGRFYQESATNFSMIDDSRPEIYDSFEKNKEIITFSLTDGGKELRDKINYYLTHEVERLTIKNAAMSKTLRTNTWVHRLSKLIEFVKEHKK